MGPSRSTLLLVPTLILAVVIGVTSALIIRAARGEPPPPTPIPGAPTTGPVSRPDSARPPYFVVPTALAGKVGHLTGTISIFTEGSPDPANGRTLNFDAWTQFGPDGSSLLFHGLWTYEDGSFHQEILTTPTEETVVVEPAAAIRPPESPPVCVTRGTPPPQVSQGRVPDFVNAAALPGFGFQQQGSGPPTRVPAPHMPTIAVVRIPPINVYGSDATLQYWRTRSSRPNGSTITTTFEVGDQGRVQVLRTQTVDAQGRVVYDSWAANGPLEVYDAASVPADVFKLTREGCGA